MGIKKVIILFSFIAITEHMSAQIPTIREKIADCTDYLHTVYINDVNFADNYFSFNYAHLPLSGYTDKTIYKFNYADIKWIKVTYQRDRDKPYRPDMYFYVNFAWDISAIYPESPRKIIMVCLTRCDSKYRADLATQNFGDLIYYKTDKRIPIY